MNVYIPYSYSNLLNLLQSLHPFNPFNLALTLRFIRENYRLRKLFYRKLMRNPKIIADDYKRILRYNILLDRLNICNKLEITNLNLISKYFDEEIEKKIKNVRGVKINQDEGLHNDNMINGDFSYNIAVYITI